MCFQLHSRETWLKEGLVVKVSGRHVHMHACRPRHMHTQHKHWTLQVNFTYCVSYSFLRTINIVSSRECSLKRLLPSNQMKHCKLTWYACVYWMVTLYVICQPKDNVVQRCFAIIRIYLFYKPLVCCPSISLYIQLHTASWIDLGYCWFDSRG